MAAVTWILLSALEQVSLTNAVIFMLTFLIFNQLWHIYDLRGMPPGPRLFSIPLFGDFLSFDAGGVSVADHTRSLRARYGKLSTVKLGCWKVVFASSAESVKEVLVTKSGDFAGRPPFESFKMQTLGGKDIVFGNYGNAWKLHRKLFVTALRQYLGNTAVVEKRVTEQANTILEYFENQQGKVFDPADALVTAVARVTGSISFGENFIASSTFKQLLAVNVEGMSNAKEHQILLVLNAFPAIAKYFPAYKHNKMICDTAFGIIRQELRKREENFDLKQPINDLISGLLKAKYEISYESEEERAVILSTEHLICTLEDMFVAGYDTTSTTLRWAIAYLIHHPKYQLEIQQEIDNVIGRHRKPRLDDRPRLPLVHATIMETLRVCNTVDAAIPHYSLRDTTLCGYRVPKDTVVMVDLESVHMDPKCWNNPTEFNPHRHIDMNGNLVTDQGNFLAFSAGRRVCAGEPLAKVELFLFLTTMLQKYSFIPAEGEPLPDLVGLRGITKFPKPYRICAVNRK